MAFQKVSPGLVLFTSAEKIMNFPLWAFLTFAERIFFQIHSVVMCQSCPLLPVYRYAILLTNSWLFLNTFEFWICKFLFFCTNFVYVVCCPTEDIKFADTPTELSYSIGSSALLECIATGQPMPSVSWRFNRRKITPGNADSFNIRIFIKIIYMFWSKVVPVCIFYST